jgi:hypothetical protein
MDPRWFLNGTIDGTIGPIRKGISGVFTPKRSYGIARKKRGLETILAAFTAWRNGTKKGVPETGAMSDKISRWGLNVQGIPMQSPYRRLCKNLKS